MQDRADGTYFDGVTAEGHEAYLLLAGDYLMITPEGFGAVYWPLDEIATAHDVRRGHLRLQASHDPDARLIVEDAEIAAALRRRAPWLDTRHGRRHGHISRRKRVFGAIAATALIALIALEGLPRLATLAPTEWLAPFGENIRAEVAYGMGEGYCDAPAAEAAGRRLLALLADAAGEDVGVINLRFAAGDVINAIAAPGGQLLAFEGLIAFSKTPEAFASVIAHEFAHALERHPTRGVARSLGLTLVGEMLTGGGMGGTAAEALTGLAYTRAAEREADAMAREMLLNAGIGTVGMASFFERLQARVPDASGGPVLLESHPRLSDRVEAAAATRGTRPAMSAADWRAIQNAC